MKKYTGVIAVICTVILIMTMFAGCKSKVDMSDSEYLGTWQAVSCEYSEFVMDASEIIGSYIITLNSDGTYDATMGDDESGSGTWIEVDGGFQLNKDSDLTFLKDEGDMVLNYDDMLIYFESV